MREQSDLRLHSYDTSSNYLHKFTRASWKKVNFNSFHDFGNTSVQILYISTLSRQETLIKTLLFLCPLDIVGLRVEKCVREGTKHMTTTTKIVFCSEFHGQVYHNRFRGNIDINYTTLLKTLLNIHIYSRFTLSQNLFLQMYLIERDGRFSTV